LAAFKDWKVIIMATAQFGVTAMLYGYSTFLPTIIGALGYSGVHAQLLTIPCYTCGATVYCIIAFISDKTKRRGPLALAGCLVGGAGYSILLGTPHRGAGAQYAGCIVVAAGLYVSVGIPLSWLSNNIPSHYKRAAGHDTQFTMANCTRIIAPFIYLTKETPTYTLGHATTLGLVVLSLCIFAAMTCWFRWENIRRDRGERDHVLGGKTALKIARMGDGHPSYRYMW
jgi:MFS family permease